MKSGHSCVYDRPTSQATGTEQYATPRSPGETCVAPISSPAAPVPQSHVTEPDTTLTNAAVDDSPASTVSSSRPAIGTAAAGWFGMLLDDTALEFDTEAGTALCPVDTNGFDQDESYTPQSMLTQSPAQASSVTEHSLWQCSERIPLSSNEYLLFENFVRRISRWLDLFDPEDNFSTLVPRLAVRQAGHASTFPLMLMPDVQHRPHERSPCFVRPPHLVEPPRCPRHLP